MAFLLRVWQLRQRDIDAVLVHVRTDVGNGRLTHTTTVPETTYASMHQAILSRAAVILENMQSILRQLRDLIRPEHPSTAYLAEERAVIAAARQLMQASDSPGALALLRPLLLERSAGLEALLMAAQLEVDRGDFRSAHDLYKRAERLAPDHPGVCDRLADLKHLQHDLRAELRYRRKALDIKSPPSVDVGIRWLRCALQASAVGVKTSTEEILRLTTRVLANPALNPVDHMKLAEALYSVPDQGPRARSMYLEAAPAAAEETNQTVAWTGLDEWVEQSGAALRRDDAITEGPYAVAELEGVCPLAGFQWVPLVARRTVALEGFLLRPPLLRRLDPQSPVLLSGPRTLELRCRDDGPEISTPAVLLGGTAQYYHHSIEHLGRLAVVEALGVDPSLPVIINEEPAPFQLEQLALLGFNEDRIIRIGTSSLTTFKKLWVPTVPAEGSSWISPLVPQWARRRLVPLSGSDGTLQVATRRRLYLSRSGVGRRGVGNEDELLAALLPLGFERVDPEQLSVAEQIRLFSCAEVLVAPTGAALTNMIFMPPGATIVVLYGAYAKAAKDSASGLYFDALCEACGHRYVALSGLSTPGGETDVAAVNSAFSIDRDQLLAVLHEVL